MAKKTYKTYSLKGLQILLFDDHGSQIEVNFKAGAQIDSTAKFSTSDEKVQEAIEKCSGFNRDFYLESVREDKTVAEPVAEEEVMPPTESADTVTGPAAEETEAEAEAEADDGNVVKVADKSEAVEWLKEHYPEEGYTGVKLRTMAAVNEVGKKHGVVFKIAE